MEVDKNLEKVKKEAEKVFKDIKEVYCPYFSEKVAFNSRGVKHIKFKADRLARERKDQFMRLKNVHLAPIILLKSSTLQEIQRRNIFVEVKTNTRKEKILKNATYYGFISIIEDGSFKKRVKVIVRQIDGGNKHFWSIIPFWNNNKGLKLYSGNLEED
ncbi:MAG: hypothetical protein NUV64_03300 [Parcubacteria group bacterium]|nr:hypothetical protein [Parcubacteria group bacterium]MCR4342393.1 hypothetical protein [Patescibacteria group bacterium]